MTEVYSSGPVLSDSLFKTRPHFGTYFKYDKDNRLNCVQQIEERRRSRQMKFPTLIGRKDVDSFKTPQTPTDPAFRKWNDEGDSRAPAPYRSCDNMLDPISGFVSPAGDVSRNTGHTHIPSFVQLNTTPQSRAPQDVNSIRAGDPCAPLETQRSSDREQGAPYSWNSKQLPDSALRASLNLTLSGASRESDKLNSASLDNKALRDKLALRYQYTSSTQRAYEQVPWDNVLAPRRFPPTTTLEAAADPISQRFTKKRYEPQAEEWQRIGPSWDKFQTRRGYYKPGAPIPGTVFCSPCPRAQQIPSYGGCIGAENLEEIDNAREPFEPFTVKRNPQPWVAETSHRPNIPNYAGCTLYRPETAPAHSGVSDPPTTTGRVHRPFTVDPNTSVHCRRSIMSRMVTTVPPSNPSTKVGEP